MLHVWGCFFFFFIALTEEKVGWVVFVKVCFLPYGSGNPVVKTQCEWSELEDQTNPCSGLLNIYLNCLRSTQKCVPFPKQRDK